MKTFKIVLLSIITAVSISCSKDEEPQPSLYGKWEYHYVNYPPNLAKTILASDYPGNVPGCKKDYLYFLHDKTVLQGDFYDTCQLDVVLGKWKEQAAILTLDNIEFSGDYRIEFMDINTLKLTFMGYSPDKKASNFFILKRPPLEL